MPEDDLDRLLDGLGALAVRGEPGTDLRVDVLVRQGERVAQGAPVHHLKECWGCFVPDGESALFGEVAGRIAAVGQEAMTLGISPESEPTTGTPQAMASINTRPNCSFQLGRVREGSTRASSWPFTKVELLVMM